jgi:hypothetical protein
MTSTNDTFIHITKEIANCQTLKQHNTKRVLFTESRSHRIWDVCVSNFNDILICYLFLQQDKRFHVVQELYNVEKEYVEALKVLVEVSRGDVALSTGKSLDHTILLAEVRDGFSKDIRLISIRRQRGHY